MSTNTVIRTKKNRNTHIKKLMKICYDKLIKIQYFLRSFRGIGTWTKYRYKTGSDYQKTSTYRPNKGHDKHFVVQVLGQSVSISAGLVPGPALCPGAGAT
jgi:hypothetical protein